MQTCQSFVASSSARRYAFWPGKPSASADAPHPFAKEVLRMPGRSPGPHRNELQGEKYLELLHLFGNFVP